MARDVIGAALESRSDKKEFKVVVTQLRSPRDESAGALKQRIGRNTKLASLSLFFSRAAAPIKCAQLIIPDHE